MKVNMFIPKYMIDFKCVNTSCPDTCCAGWDINIDEDTYKKYINSTGKLNKLIDGKYIKNTDEHDYFNHGFMILKDEKRCPFLDDNSLCDIHGGCGEDNLCITCKSYPRVFNIVDGVYEKSGLSSCEEICIRAFLNKDKMEFVEIEEEIDEKGIEIRRIVDSEAFDGSESLLQYFWDIRVISINIMQLKKFTVEERLNILFKFYEQIDMLRSLDDFENIEELLEEFKDEEMNFENLKGIPFNEENKFYQSIAKEELLNNIRSIRLKKCVDEYKNGIASKPDISKYINEISKYNCELDEYSYIFENYLINQIFKDLIPFNKGESLMVSIRILINSYRIIKAYIIGIAINSQEKITEKQIIRVIQALSKDIEHSKVFKEILES